MSEDKRHREADDWCTQTGARMLATQIEEYWADRGHIVYCTVTQRRPGSGDYDVRSNMLGALPRTWPRGKAA